MECYATDIQLNNSEDFQIKGSNTVIQKRESATDKVRIVAYVSDSILCQISVKEELMSIEFPSIWLELRKKHTTPVAICGMYREWCNEKYHEKEKKNFFKAGVSLRKFPL